MLYVGLFDMLTEAMAGGFSGPVVLLGVSLSPKDEPAFFGSTD